MVYNEMFALQKAHIQLSTTFFDPFATKIRDFLTKDLVSLVSN